MARITDKCRLCRRERVKLFLKGGRCLSPKCPIEKRGAVPPGFYGIRSGIKPSDYAIQLREKQKAKRYYGILEKQFKNYYQKASGLVNRGEGLLKLLEMRLDNVIHRLGLAPSRAMARQLVNHGHILVNGKKVKIPSYQVKVGDQISLDKKAEELVVIEEWLARKEVKIPRWLEKKGKKGKVLRMPKREEMPQDINENLIIEFYSR